jgi:protein-disulfide isomerase
MDTELTPPSASETQVAPPLAETTPPPAAGPSPKRYLRWLYLFPFVFALGILTGYLIFAMPLRTKLEATQKELAAAQTGGSQDSVNVPQNVKRYDIPVDGFPSSGPKDAKITIVEFSDYECPFCKQWHAQVWPQLQKKYGSQIRLVYRDFPLFGLHNNAEPAAEAAHCADDQGKYWEYHDQIFTGSYPLSRSGYDGMASALGLDVKKFDACLDAGTYKNIVQANYDFASNLGVQSTPTFFVNGMAMVGAQPFETFDKVIQMEINGQIPKN